MAVGSHPFPFRTRKLSPPAPMVLGRRLPGRVGRRRISHWKRDPFGGPFFVPGPGQIRVPSPTDRLLSCLALRHLILRAPAPTDRRRRPRDVRPPEDRARQHRAEVSEVTVRRLVGHRPVEVLPVRVRLVPPRAPRVRGELPVVAVAQRPVVHVGPPRVAAVAQPAAVHVDPVQAAAAVRIRRGVASRHERAAVPMIVQLVAPQVAAAMVPIEPRRIARAGRTVPRSRPLATGVVWHAAALVRPPAVEWSVRREPGEMQSKRPAHNVGLRLLGERHRAHTTRVPGTPTPPVARIVMRASKRSSSSSSSTTTPSNRLRDVVHVRQLTPRRSISPRRSGPSWPRRCRTPGVSVWNAAWLRPPSISRPIASPTPPGS